MTRFFQLIPRYLRKNKKRTFLTGMGITLAAVLLISLTMTIPRFQQEKVEKAMEQSGGRYHAARSGVKGEYLGQLYQDKEIKEIGTALLLGKSPKEKGKIKYEISAYEEKAQALLQMNVIEGSYPTKEKEIAIEKTLLQQIKPSYKLGEKIKLSYEVSYKEHAQKEAVYKGETEFVLSGILEDTVLSKARQIGKACVSMDTARKLLPQEAFIFTQYFTMKGKPTSKDIQDLAKRTHCAADPNSELLRSYKLEKTMNRLLFFLKAVVVLVATLVIYNIFSISVIERYHEFGILRATGAEPGQIVFLLIGEAVVLGSLCIPLGIILGAFFTNGFLYMLSSTPVEKLLYPSLVGVLQTFFICFMAILIAVYYPMKKAGEISPIEAVGFTSLEQEGGKGKKKTKGKGISTRLSFTTAMAYMNIKRNKKRFWATVSSLSIGALLFILTTTIIHWADPVASAEKRVGADYVLGVESRGAAENGYRQEGIEELRQLEGVEAVIPYHYFTPSILPLSNRVTDSYKEWKKQNVKVGTIDEYNVLKEHYYITCQLYGYEDDQLELLKKYIDSGKVDIEQLKKEPVALLVQNLNYSYNTTLTGTDKVVVQRTIPIEGAEPERQEKEIKIQGLLKEFPFPLEDMGTSTILIMHKDRIEELFEIPTYQRVKINVKEEKNKSSMKQKLASYVKTEKGQTFYSYEEEIEEMKKIQGSMSVVLYSFVMITALIGMVNIINTMSMNVMLRKREFGMLRAIGMGNQEVRRMILKEGAYYGIFSSIIGSILGGGLYGILYSFVKQDPTIVWAFPWKAILATLGMSILLSVLASIGPLRKLLSDSIIASIRTIE